VKGQIKAMDPLSTTLLFMSLVVLAASWIMLIIAASSSDDYAWTLTSVFMPPLAYLYALYRWETAGDSIKAAMLGFGLMIVSLLF